MTFHTHSRFTIYTIAMAVVLLILVAVNLIFGSVKIDPDAVLRIICGSDSENAAWTTIVLQSRVPMIITAILAGAALSVSGLLLQTAFNNPLAGPSILGVSTGAGLGVAIVMLLGGGSLSVALSVSLGRYLAILIGAIAGAAFVLIALLAMSALVRSGTMLLIVGVLVGYLASSIIALLNFFATDEGVHSYTVWGLGNFSGVSLSQMPMLAIPLLLTLGATFLLMKPLNALLLGTRYAENLGINVQRTRNLLLLYTGILTAVVTAFCGPIGFIGLIVPHIARILLGTSNHNQLLPATLLAGANLALICTLISTMPSNGVIPINAITPVIGVPIIVYVIINRRKLRYFN